MLTVSCKITTSSKQTTQMIPTGNWWSYMNNTRDWWAKPRPHTSTGVSNDRTIESSKVLHNCQHAQTPLATCCIVSCVNSFCKQFSKRCSTKLKKMIHLSPTYLCNFTHVIDKLASLSPLPANAQLFILHIVSMLHLPTVDYLVEPELTNMQHNVFQFVTHVLALAEQYLNGHHHCMSVWDNVLCVPWEVCQLLFKFGHQELLSVWYWCGAWGR